MHITVDHVRQAVQLNNFDGLAAQAPMAPLSRPMRQLAPDPSAPPARQAGVLVLIYPEPTTGTLQLALTRRQAHLRGHSGQISFPGGRAEEHDHDFVHTALRETCEELGICEDKSIEVLGMLTKVYIPPSNHDVYPVVGLMHADPRFIPNHDEVAEVFGFGLPDLLNPKTKQVTRREFRGQFFDVPYYHVNGHEVWGATAVMLSEFEHRLRVVLGQRH